MIGTGCTSRWATVRAMGGLAAVIVLGCSDSVTTVVDPGDDDDTRPEAQLTFLKPGQEAPPP